MTLLIPNNYPSPTRRLGDLLLPLYLHCPSHVTESLTATPKMEHMPLPTPTPFGMLCHIPPELRLQIYRKLILNGSVQILRSSRAIHREAIQVLFREGVCRLEFNDYKSINLFPSPFWSRNTIMNMEIRLVLNHTYKSNKVYSRCIEKFNSWMTEFRYCIDRGLGLEARYEDMPRGSCKILIDCDKSFIPYLPRRTFTLIQFLDGFDKLTLAIADDYPAESKARINERLRDPEPDPLRGMEAAMHSLPSEDTKYVYGLAKKALDPALGVGKLICDAKGAHLEFQLRGYEWSPSTCNLILR